MKRYKKPIIIISVLLVVIIAALIATDGAAPLREKFNIMRGNKYIEKERYEDAILAFEKAVRIKETNIASRLKLSELYITTGQNDKAKQFLKETLFLGKTNQDAYILFASIYEKEKNYVELIKLLDEGLSVSSEKDKLQAEFDKLLAEVNVSDINATIEQDERFTLSELAQLQINGDMFQLPIEWKEKDVDTSKFGVSKLEGNIKYINKTIVTNLDIKIKPIVVSEKKITKKDKKYIIDYRIPVIATEGRYSENAAVLSSAIEEYFNKTLSQDMEVAKAAAEDEFLKGDTKYEFKVKYKVSYNKDGIISIVMTYYSFTGGVHGNSHNISYNYNVVEGKELELQDAFSKEVNPSDIVKGEIVKQIKQDKSRFFEDSMDVVKNYSEPFDFYITEQGVVIYFEEYEIAPYAGGMPEFLITKNVAIK